MKSTFKRGKKLYKQGRYDLAKNEFLELIEAANDNPDIPYYMALTLSQLGEYNDAISYLDHVISFHPNLFQIFQCRMVLGYIYTITERYKLAQMEFEKLKELGLESAQVFASLGYVLYSLKMVEQAIQNFEKALEYKPDYAGALNNLGFIYAQENLDIDKAIEYSKRAVKIKPENPVYLDSLGWALYKKGKLLDARAYLRRALDIAPKNKEISTHLKQVLKELEI
jgi:tetratricopeptide (TPR) repeat protein